MQTAADHNAHVTTAEIQWEARAYRSNVIASHEAEDFGDRCYYSEQADDCLTRLREMGAHDVANALAL